MFSSIPIFFVDKTLIRILIFLGIFVEMWKKVVKIKRIILSSE